MIWQASGTPSEGIDPLESGGKTGQFGVLSIVLRNLRYNRAAVWRGARAVEWDGLENRCGLRATVGSNPTLSAIDSLPPWVPERVCHSPAGTLSNPSLSAET
jgi:hypothetical protein